MGHQFLPFFYEKSLSNLTPNGSFKICSSWRFKNTPYMLNLMKFWLRYVMLKTIDTPSKFNFISTLLFWKLSLAFNLEYLSNFCINFQHQWQFQNPHDEQIPKLPLIFEFDEEISEIIGNEKDEMKLIFEKYQLSLTSNISAQTSSNWACRGCFVMVTKSRF